MFDPRQWLDDCERALADADYLATRLARVSGHPGTELAALLMRITALRAEFERARMELGYGEKETAVSPPAGAGSPWCVPVPGERD